MFDRKPMPPSGARAAASRGARLWLRDGLLIGHGCREARASGSNTALTRPQRRATGVANRSLFLYFGLASLAACKPNLSTNQSGMYFLYVGEV